MSFRHAVNRYGHVSLIVVGLLLLPWAHDRIASAAAVDDLSVAKFSAYADGTDVTLTMELCTTSTVSATRTLKLWANRSTPPSCSDAADATVPVPMTGGASPTCVVLSGTAPFTEGNFQAWAGLECLTGETNTNNNRAWATFRVASGLCPRGYLHDASETKYTVCKRGSDEVVRAGDGWVDRYESVLVDAAYFNGGKCDGTATGKRYGAASTDDYPAGFADNGAWTTPVYACSSTGAVPSGWMTWFQASQACALAGKHLCTNDEWQTAAGGTPDTATACNVLSLGRVQNGSRPNCTSNWGARNMAGNSFEWVAWWGAGNTPSPSGTITGKPWPSGYGDDQVWGVDGSGYTGFGDAEAIPVAARRGAGFANSTGAGVFSFNITDAPSAFKEITSARCCMRR